MPSTSIPPIQHLKTPSSTTSQHNPHRRITSLPGTGPTPRQRSHLLCRAPEMMSRKRSQSAAWRASYDYDTNMWSVSVIRPRLGWRYIARLRTVVHPLTTILLRLVQRTTYALVIFAATTPLLPCLTAPDDPSGGTYTSCCCELAKRDGLDPNPGRGS
jgi:hypothetical protein